MEVEADSPYDVLGVNHNMSDANVKKRYVLLCGFLIEQSNNSFCLIFVFELII